ncbi:hypothetical protein Tco_0645590 [Tanacetum coccineum]
MVKNVDSMVKFWMYPRFEQVFVNKQVGDTSHHKRIYATPSHTKKIFGNMKREGKGFSGRVTPLFQTMMVQLNKRNGDSSKSTDPITHPALLNHIIPNLRGRQKSEVQEKEHRDLCTNLQKKVHDLEKAKTAQDSEIVSLKKKVKKLERRNKSRTPRLKRLRKVGSARRVESSDESKVTLIDKTQGRNDDNLIFDTGVLDEQEVKVEKVVSIAEVTTESATTITVDELTLAQTLIEIKAAKPKVKGVMIQEPSEFTTTTPAVSKPSQDKGKAKMIESEKPLKKKDQIMYDQEVSLNLQALLQAELEEEERLTRQKEEEANIDLIESWDNTQAMMDADYQMAQQLQAEEQEQLSIEEKSKLFVQLLEVRKKRFAEMRAKEKRNKPSTQTQQRNLYCNYLKNMKGYTLKQLKGFKFEVIKDMFNKAFKRVNTFVDYKTKLVEDDDQEEAEMKKLIKVVPNEEKVAIDAIPLATKPPSIVDWKIIKEGKINLFQIIRANGSSKRYSSIIQMLKDFDREDLETLWKLVKAKHGSTRLEDGYERVLWGDLMTMFEPDVESPVWRTLQIEKVLIWKLFDSYGVHFLRLQSMHLFMLVENRYPLTPATITEMLNKKLQTDHWNEMIKSFIRLFGITAALIKDSAAQEESTARVKLVLLVENEENILSSYYCLYTVNAAGVYLIAASVQS